MHEDELRADLQQTYGIDLDKAMGGEHSAAHIAALTAQLPAGARIRVCESPDDRWTSELCLLALIANQLNMLLYMLGAKKGDKKPALIGPSWMTGARSNKVDAQVMTIEQLRAELAKPRRAQHDKSAVGGE